MKKTKSSSAARVLLAMGLGLGLVATTVAGGASAHDGPEEHDFTLTILHNNDGESALLPDGDEGGVARFERVLRQEKRAAKRAGNGVVFLSSGDNFLAGPAFTASLADGVYYDALALNRLRYDAMALGNHDFDFGPDILAEFIVEHNRPAKPRFLSANLDFSAEPNLQALVDATYIANSRVVRERGERIGIIGATTENLPFISSPRNVVVNAVLPAVEAELAALEAQGIDKIILISHLQDIEADILLAEQLSGIDVMIAGGGDELLANPSDPLLPSDDPSDIFGAYPQLATDAAGATVPVVTTSGSYGYLGKLNVYFDGGDVVAFDGGPRRVVAKSVGPDGVGESRKLSRIVEPVAEFVADLESTVIAQTEVELDGTRAGVRSVETNQGNLIADSQLWQAQQVAPGLGLDSPQVALANGGGIRNDSIIAPGADPGATQDITLLDTFDMVPFPNFVTIVPDIPRSQFKEILENAVSRTQPGDIPGGTGRFAQVAGFSFVYDGAGTAQELDADGNVTVAGTRVQTVTLDDGTSIVSGGAVVAGDAIDIAIVDFLARGGDQYPFRGAAFDIIGISYQQALANYIQADLGDGGLGALITETQYPEGGEGRTVEL